MTVCERLRLVRKQLHFTQEEVCQKLSKGEIYCETKPSVLSRYETDQRTPDFHFLKAFCLCFNVNGHWLLCGEGEMFNIPHTNKDPKMSFLALSDLIENGKVSPPDFYSNQNLNDFTQNTPDNFLFMLIHMIKENDTRYDMFRYFYYFTKSNQ